MKRVVKLVIPMLCICLIFVLLTSVNFAKVGIIKPTLVIDAGHGGIDGGAVGQNEISEKDINLSIALTLAQIAMDNGWKVILTRDSDISLGGDDGSIRSRKMKDLAERKKVIDKERADVTVSIHLNSFPQDSSCKGAQTFYPSEQDEQIREKSQLLAELIQDNLTEGLDIEKARKPMKKNQVYIFKQPTSPIALVECGFLSNPTEEKLLQDKDYQYKIAVSIFKGIEKYNHQQTGKNFNENIENLVISNFDDTQKH